MNVLWTPIPLPSTVVVGAYSSLREARSKLAEAVSGTCVSSARTAAEAYATLWRAAAAAPFAGVTWLLPGDKAVASFSRETESAMLAQLRAALCMREAAQCGDDGERRCTLLAETLSLLREATETPSTKARMTVIELLIHTEYISAAASNAPPGAWRAVHARATAAAQDLRAAGDEGYAAAEALASDALARACEAAAEARYAETRFVAAAELSMGGRPSFAERASQLAAIAANRGLALRQRTPAELVDMLPAEVALPALH